VRTVTRRRQCDPHLVVEPRTEGLYDGTMVHAVARWWSDVAAARPWLDAEIRPTDTLNATIEPANQTVLTDLSSRLFAARPGVASAPGIETSTAALALAYAMTHVIQSSIHDCGTGDRAPRAITIRHVEDSRWALTPLAAELMWGEQRPSLIEFLSRSSRRHRHLPRTIMSAYDTVVTPWGLSPDQVVETVDHYVSIRGRQKGYRLVFDRAFEFWFAERVDFAGAAEDG
jgi:hypothetical protein